VKGNRYAEVADDPAAIAGSQSVVGIPVLSTDTGVPPATGTEPLGVKLTLAPWSNVHVEVVTLPTETVRSVPAETLVAGDWLSAVLRNGGEDVLPRATL
jgi:hypothetical protein